MNYRTREEQLKGTPTIKTFRYRPEDSELLDDTILDGDPISNKSIAITWVEENDVHRAPRLSSEVDTSRYFLGAQQLLVRDDIRHKTHIAIPEASGLVLATTSNSDIETKVRVFNGTLVRAHITLIKATGIPRVTFVGIVGDEPILHLDQDIIETKAVSPDFPFVCFSQPPIGHVPTDEPSFGLLTYKCRKTGTIFVRRIEGDRVLDERLLTEIKTVGGADLAISGKRVLVRLNSVVDKGLQPMVARSDDAGQSFSDFEPIIIEKLPTKRFLPANASVFVDYTGKFHIPIIGEDGEKMRLIDVMPDEDLAVEAIVADAQIQPYETVAAFPKKPKSVALSEGFGDGLTDGVGIIVNVLEKGAILASNSQSGGYQYPTAAFINYDMPRAYTLKATQCYTRGVNPNTVSMDYVLIEADSFGNPISKDLLVETWDMPLPEPTVSASLADTQLNITIDKDGWFITGKTQFEISDPTVEIISFSLEDERSAILKLSKRPEAGSSVIFRSRDLFYFHEGSAFIR